VICRQLAPWRHPCPALVRAPRSGSRANVHPVAGWAPSWRAGPVGYHHPTAEPDLAVQRMLGLLDAHGACGHHPDVQRFEDDEDAYVRCRVRVDPRWRVAPGDADTVRSQLHPRLDSLDIQLTREGYLVGVIQRALDRSATRWWPTRAD
jgi:hypothetical protein